MKRTKIQSNPKLDKANKVIKTIYFILYFLLNIAVVGMLVYAGWEELNSPNTEDLSILGFFAIFIFFGMIVGCIGHAVLLVLATIGAVCAGRNKGNSERAKTVGFYIFMIILPIITQAIIIGGSLLFLEVVA